MILENRFIPDDFFPQLDIKRRLWLIKFYEQHKNLKRSHLYHWKQLHLKTTDLMLFMNEIDLLPLYEKMDLTDAKQSTMYVNHEGVDYILIATYGTVTLVNIETNEMHMFHVSTWKYTELSYYEETSTGYGWGGHPEHNYYSRLTLNNAEIMEMFSHFTEFKYIDFSKLKFVNIYHIFHQRKDKEYLWQLEMLLKSDFIRFAQDFSSSVFSKLDFKVFMQYQDFFRKKGRSIYHYERIMDLREKGFEDPQYMYLDNNVSWYNLFWIKFLGSHDEIKRNRFLKYIKNRKSSKTKFGMQFLDVYKKYLEFMVDMKFDLSKNKYAFPDDLIKEIEEICEFVDIEAYKYREFKDMYIYWQSNLPLNEQSEKYVIYYKKTVDKLKKEEAKRIAVAKKAEAAKKRNLKLLWDYNKHISMKISDKFVLLAPTSSEELIIEGKTLNHCVGSYVDRLAKHETTILFLRKVGYEDKPFFTIEVKNGKVVQCRSTNNIVNPEISELIRSYVEIHNNELVLQM